MTRCDLISARPASPGRRRALRALPAAVLALAAVPAAAQAPRVFPATALRGELVVEQGPQVRLNGQPARLAPGARIRDERNLVQLSNALAGQKLPVHYTLDTSGGLLDVWVLTPAELARRPWPTTVAQARAWRFDPSNQTWTPR
jgi:hypothetical protein